MSVRLGISPIGWSNDDLPELGGDIPLDTCLAEAGDGAIDFVAVLGALKAANYHGWLVVEAEQDPAKAPPLVYARRGFAYLSAALRDMEW
jgi:hypothetical protein